ncbi:ribosome-associated translation inhibitor RaiA [Ulvibacterium sp.]|uniref:ribosome hibernation-promoting factor, HPF/YfiA family n=1 Tax=Ulvibacterium sp. TaxID=2665914 RepID=UPI00260CD43C|nr:ribosome-associated translation inhibitor RaiA [Ulvibacterium sp.]
MTIDVQFIQMPTSEAMEALVSKKLNVLARKYDWIIRAQVQFKQEKDPTGKGKICEMELSAPGPRIFAKSNEDDFEKAAASTIKELERQLSKRKSTFQKH